MTFRRGQDDHLDGIQRRVRDLEGQDGGPLLVEDVPGVHVAILPEHLDENQGENLEILPRDKEDRRSARTPTSVCEPLSVRTGIKWMRRN